MKTSFKNLKMMPMNIKNYHFHLYYELNDLEIEKATSILQKLRTEKEEMPIGRIWEKPVGPHPIGSCQVTVKNEHFREMIEWFLKNRKGLSLFIHPNTGNDLADHTEHTIWLGHEFTLKTDLFHK